MSIEKRKKYIAAFVLVIVALLYSYTYFNTFPVSEGWGIMYAEQVFQGKVPYRDFYYYLPPLNLIFDSLFWKLSFGHLVVYRFCWLCQRIVMQLLIFNLLNKFFSLKSSFIACFFAVFLCTANVYDLLGDYNQTMMVWIVLLAYFTTAFARAEDEKKKYKQLFFAGIIIGLMFLTKQTVFLAAVIVHFVLLTYFCIRQKNKNYWSYCLSVILGAAIPVVIASAYLLVNGAFFPFIEEVFLNVDGKGSMLDILTAGLKAVFAKYNTIAIALTGILGWRYILDGKNQSKRTKVIRGSLAFATFAMVLVSYYYRDVHSFDIVFLKGKSGRVLLIALILPCIVLTILRKWNKFNDKIWYLYDAYVVVCVLGMASFSKSFNADVYENTGLFTLVGSQFYPAIFMMLLAILMMCLCGQRGKKYKSKEDEIYLLGAAFSGVYAAMMGSGSTDFGYFGTFLMVPLVLCYVFDVVDFNQIGITVMKYNVATIVLLLCMGCVVQKTNCAYSWWGTVDEPLAAKTETSDLKALGGGGKIIVSSERIV